MKSNTNRFEDELFIKAAKLWNLEKLYIELAHKKNIATNREIKLTPVEKACLRGLLCGYPPKKIAAALHWSCGSLSVQLTKGLYRYVETLTNRKSNTLKSWRDISIWLEAAGYKTPQQCQDWGEAPQISAFYGRTRELNTLKQWISLKGSQLVAILGIVGVGKTSLAAKLAREIQEEFDYIIWRSLSSAQPLKQLLTQLIPFLSHHHSSELPEDINLLMSHFLECLREHRCLVILDDAEQILSRGTLVGQYQAGYEDYGQLFRRVAQERHQSCLLLISWEPPLQMELLEKKNYSTRSLTLNGLPTEDARKLLAANGLSEQEQDMELIKLYRGNPLGLKLAVTTIKDFFFGSVSEFLSWGEVIVPEPMRAMLIEQLNRLDESEKKVIAYLARNPTPIYIKQLRHSITLDYNSQLISVLQSLERRSLIEKISHSNRTFFTIIPVIRTVINQHEGCLP
ncbi:MAG: AAA family ATPase [Moorea sp. SIO3G5]|nr:AAA family ATPase [Moorena sp. SIO3G5]